MEFINSNPPDSWYDPPKQHEICNCYDCHKEGYHQDNRKTWMAQECFLCESMWHKEKEEGV